MSEVRSASLLSPKDIARKSGRETIYYCPFCPEIRGKPDKEGKLYYNEQKGVGYCQKCNVRVINNSIGSVNAEADRFLLRHQAPSDVKYSVIDLSWTQEVHQIPEVHSYLRRRRISDSQIRKYRILGCRDPFLGVVLPAKDLGNKRTDFIQVRDIRKNAWVKYRGVSDTVKPVFGIDMVVRSGTTCILAEGVFSAISATRLDPTYVPLCTYGKSVASHQIKDFKGVAEYLEEVIVMYDGGFFWDNIEAARSLKLILPDTKISLAFLPDKTDPNDIDDCELDEVIQSRTEYTPTIRRILISQYVKSGSYEEFYRRYRESYYEHEA